MENKKAKTITDIVDVVRTGDKISIPESLTYTRAIKVLEAKVVEEETVVGIRAEVNAFVLEGCYALNKVLAEKFGFTIGKPTPGFFGSTPPTSIDIETGYDDGRVRSVPALWGHMEIPGVEGYISTATWMDGDVVKFLISGEVKKKNERVVNEIIEETRYQCAKNSIYKGKSFSLKLTDSRTNEVIPMPRPAFLNAAKDVDVVFSETTQAAIDVSIFTPIQYTDRCRAAGVPLKRGILLEGPWGVGKTLIARSVMHHAVANGWTYINCENINDLSGVLHLARNYGPTVVFCEDIDKVTKGERTISMDEILNTVDGVSSKTQEVIIVMTTNEVESINQAMLRPGRLDAIISIRQPDAKAAERLMRLYGRELIPANEDLSEVAQLLAGCQPCAIQEVVERSKLAAIRHSDGGEIEIHASDILHTIPTMEAHLAKLQPKVEDNRSDIEKAADRLGEHLASSFRMPDFSMIEA